MTTEEAIATDIPKIRRLGGAVNNLHAVSWPPLQSDDAKATYERAIKDLRNIASYLLNFGTTK